MATPKINPARKKKIKSLLALMNKQNQRFIPIAASLVEMMDMVITDEELNYLLQMGTESYDYGQALRISAMPEDQFQGFFDNMQRKGLIHVQDDTSGQQEYRLNAIAVGWYEVTVHNLMGKPQEKEFSEKWNEFFKFFQKFNFFPLRNLQNLVLPSMINPSQDTGIMDPKIEGKNQRKTIPIGTNVPVPNQTVYPTSFVNDLVEQFGNQDAIYAFPCVCRHGNSLIDSHCGFDIPRESCIGFGSAAKAWANWGYGRHVSKKETIDILKEVREQGAVHSVIHERDDPHLPVMAICNCCWDCCGILKPYNMGAVSLKYNTSYTARIKEDANCKGCGVCEKYCPTTAIKLKNDIVTLNSDKCIGCGQCAFQCRQNNIELYPKERIVYLPLLQKSEVRVSA